MKKVHRVIKFNQNALGKSYIDMNTKLRQKAKATFEKDCFKLMNNYGKNMENVTHKRFKIERYNVFTEEINKTVLWVQMMIKEWNQLIW